MARSLSKSLAHRLSSQLLRAPVEQSLPASQIIQQSPTRDLDGLDLSEFRRQAAKLHRKLPGTTLANTIPSREATSSKVTNLGRGDNCNGLFKCKEASVCARIGMTSHAPTLTTLWAVLSFRLRLCVAMGRACSTLILGSDADLRHATTLYLSYISHKPTYLVSTFCQSSNFCIATQSYLSRQA